MFRILGLQSCSRSASQRSGIVKTATNVGTKASQSHNRKLDFIAVTSVTLMIAVKVREERLAEA